MHEDSRREVSVKILYTFDKEHNTTYLARLPKPLEVQVICSGARDRIAAGAPSSGTIGVIDLRVCAVAMVAASPELVVEQSHDYAVYVTDYTEVDVPLVGHGMLSWILSSSPDSALNKVVGKITRNYMGFFGNASKDTLEVKVRLQPVLQLLQSDFIKSMNTFAMLSRMCPPDYDPNTWLTLCKSDPARVDSILSKCAALHSRSLSAAQGGAKLVQKGTRVYKPPRRTNKFTTDGDGPGDSAHTEGNDQGLTSRLSNGPGSERHYSQSPFTALSSPPNNGEPMGPAKVPAIPSDTEEPTQVLDTNNAGEVHAEAPEAAKDDEKVMEEIRPVSSPRLPSIPPGPDPFSDHQEPSKVSRGSLLFPPQSTTSIYSDDDYQTGLMPSNPTKRKRQDSDVSTSKGEPAQKRSRSMSPKGQKKAPQKSKRTVQKQLEIDIKAGRVPDFCENCGSIKTVNWRKVVVTEGKEIRLCNPCGVFYNKQQRQRPKEFWGDEDLPKTETERPWKVPKLSDPARPKKKRGRPVPKSQNIPAVSRSSPPPRTALSHVPNNPARSDPGTSYLVQLDPNASKSGGNEFLREAKENVGPIESPKAATNGGSPITPAKVKSGSFMEDLLKTPSRLSSALRNVCSPSPWRTGIFASAKQRAIILDGQMSPTRTIDSSNIEHELLSPQTRALTDLLQGTLNHEGFGSTETMLPSSPPPFFTSGNIQSDAWSDLVTSPMSPSKTVRQEEDTIVVDFDAYYDVLNDEV